MDVSLGPNGRYIIVHGCSTRLEEGGKQVGGF